MVILKKTHFLAIGAIAALITECTITVEREETTEEVHKENN